MSFKSARVKNGLSREEAAKEFGVSVSTIGHWERGEFAPPRKKLVKVARFYGVPLKSLFDCEGMKKPPKPKYSRAKCELTEREKEIVAARMNNKTFDEIGEGYGISRQAAHSTFQAAMYKLTAQGKWVSNA